MPSASALDLVREQQGRADGEALQLGRRSEGRGRDGDADSEGRGMESLLEEIFTSLYLSLANQINIAKLLKLL